MILKVRAWDSYTKTMSFYGPTFCMNDEWNTLTLEHTPGHSGPLGDRASMERYTLMQFIGLVDRCGFEIYEGDLLDPFFDSGSRGLYLYAVVRGHHGFDLVQRDGKPSCMLFGREILQDFKIAGNIHQHPELLKENPK